MPSNRKSHHKRVSQGRTTLQETIIRQSPIPTPEEMEKYNQIIPNAADRILKMAEDERIDRNKRENRRDEIINKSDKRDFTVKLTALFISMVIIICFLGLAYLMLKEGYANQAVAVLGVSLATIIGYVLTRKTRPSK